MILTDILFISSLFSLFERQGKIFGKSRSKLIVGVQSALYRFEMGRLRPWEGGKSCHNLAVSVMHIRLLSGHTIKTGNIEWRTALEWKMSKNNRQFSSSTLKRRNLEKVNWVNSHLHFHECLLSTKSQIRKFFGNWAKNAFNFFST